MASSVRNKAFLGPKRPPNWVPSKKPRSRGTSQIVDPVRTHLELKNYLQTRRLVVERSLNPEVRAEAKRLDLFIEYLRTLDPR